MVNKKRVVDSNNAPGAGIHTLRGISSTREVYLDGQKLSPARSQAHYNHSPDGFAWGYGGSGPAQLALAIMLELTGKPDNYQGLKWALVANLPQGDFHVRFSMATFIFGQEECNG